MTSPRFIFNTDSCNVYIKPHSVLNGKEPQYYLHSCPDLSFSEMLIYEVFPKFHLSNRSVVTKKKFYSFQQALRE